MPIVVRSQRYSEWRMYRWGQSVLPADWARYTRNGKGYANPRAYRLYLTRREAADAAALAFARLPLDRQRSLLTPTSVPA